MQGGNGCSHAEFRSDQTHAADSAGSGAQQGDHRIDAEESTAPEAHHNPCEHEGEGDQQGGSPQQLQLLE